MINISPVSAGDHTSVRVVTVSDRKAIETILSRLAKDTPLALGARGIARVRTLSGKEIKTLSPEVKAALADLPVGGHTQVMTDGDAYSIFQRTTFVFYRRAWALSREGKKDEALRKIEKDLILNPDHIKGLALIGMIYEERREYRRAAEAYQQLIGFHPNISLGYRMIGRIYELEKEWDQAIESYEFSLRLNPRQHDVMNNLALLYARRRGEPGKGLPLIERALELRPKTPEYLETLARIRKKLGLKGGARVVKLEGAPSGRAKTKAAKEPEPVISAAGPPARNGKTDASPPESGPPAPQPSLPAGADGPSPRVSADGWPPPKAPPGLPVSPPLLVGPDRRKAGTRAAEAAEAAEAARKKPPVRRELFVMNPSLREEGWGETPPAAGASGFAKTGDGPSAKVAPAPVRIQILDGTGDMSNARRVRSLLVSKGFPIARIGRSDKGLWGQTVLYYKEGSEPNAEKVAGAIPGSLLLRPLKWRSVYDIILVVGKDRVAP